MVVKCVKDNYNARFRTPRVQGHGAWLLSVSRTINIQGIILPDITAAEKCTLFLDSK